MEGIERPLFGVLKKIADEKIQQEAMLFFQFLDIKTVEKLASFTKEQLADQELSGEAIVVLEAILKKEYQQEFSKKKTVLRKKKEPVKKSRRGRPPSTEIRAGGAPPPSIFSNHLKLIGGCHE